MDKIIACCGIECHNCDAYTATRNNDDELRKKTAENWSKMFNADIQPQDVNCLGCGSEVLFAYCHDCNIRKCNVDKAQENCSKCNDYNCDKLTDFFKMAPDAKNILDSLRTQK
ncbi:MAG TPA: DUF3795 domain-containing protein [Clostridia bacterium]|nr:DUF3795 domain-containing protein [Clostridia bacterium]